jgi:hypothetical protein
MVAALASMLLACGDDDASTPDTSPTASTTTASTTTAVTESTTTVTAAAEVIEVGLTGGDVDGGPRLISVELGATVTIRATADVVEELHVHTYDLKVELTPGIAGEVTFAADIPGRHEVEFEAAGEIALTLEVG